MVDDELARLDLDDNTACAASVSPRSGALITNSATSRVAFFIGRAPDFEFQ
jgi:hypothetical protein